MNFFKELCIMFRSKLFTNKLDVSRSNLHYSSFICVEADTRYGLSQNTCTLVHRIPPVNLVDFKSVFHSQSCCIRTDQVDLLDIQRIWWQIFILNFLSQHFPNAATFTSASAPAATTFTNFPVRQDNKEKSEDVSLNSHVHQLPTVAVMKYVTPYIFTFCNYAHNPVIKKYFYYYFWILHWKSDLWVFKWSSGNVCSQRYGGLNMEQVFRKRKNVPRKCWMLGAGRAEEKAQWGHGGDHCVRVLQSILLLGLNSGVAKGWWC